MHHHKQEFIRANINHLPKPCYRQIDALVSLSAGKKGIGV